MNHRNNFGPPPPRGFGGSFVPFVLGGVVGSLLTNNRQYYPYPYPVQYYPYPYPYQYQYHQYYHYY